jgi:hypothetical protein
MHDCATSMDSASSLVRVPSFKDVERKSIIARARRFLESEVDAYGELAPSISWRVTGCDRLVP